MAIFPCDNKGLCIDPANPFQNFSAEPPDSETFIGFFTGSGPTNFYPPLGSDFFAVGCRSFCVSDTSQREADLCAARNNVDCLASVWPTATPGVDIFGNPVPIYHRRQTFLNSAQSVTISCPDGNEFTYTVPAGRYEAFTQEDADQAALSDATENAPLNIICISGLSPTQVCPNVEYAGAITASGGQLTDDNACWQLIGSLPPGMASDIDESDNGCLIGSRTLNFFGAPETSGSFSFAIQVNDAVGNFMVKVFTINVEGIANVNPMPDATATVAYSQTLTAIGVTNPIYSLESGTLPTGLSLDPTGVIFGTPTTQGASSFTLGVTEAGTGITCKIPASITVKAAPFTWANLSWGAPFLQQGDHGNTASAAAAGASFDVTTTNPLDTSTTDAVAIITGTMTYNGPLVASNLHCVWNENPANGNIAFLTATVTVSSAQNGTLLATGINRPAGTYDLPFNVPATVGLDTLTVTVNSRSKNGFNNIVSEMIGTLTP